MIVVSHDQQLVNMLWEAGGRVLELVKELGETVLHDIDTPSWSWPKR